jgi:hypothetical protein
LSPRFLLDDATFLGEEGYIRVHITHINPDKRTATIVSLHDNVEFPHIPLVELESVDDDPAYFFPLHRPKRNPVLETLELDMEERQKKIFDDAPNYDRNKRTPSWIRIVQSQLAEWFLYRHSLSKEQYLLSAKSEQNADISTPLLEMLPGIREACEFFTAERDPPDVQGIRTSVEGLASLVLLCVPSHFFIDFEHAECPIFEPDLTSIQAYRKCVELSKKFHLNSTDNIALGQAITAAEKCYPRCSSPLQEKLKVFLPSVGIMKDFRKHHIERITPTEIYSDWLSDWIHNHVNGYGGYNTMRDYLVNIDMVMPGHFSPNSTRFLGGFYEQVFSSLQTKMECNFKSGMKSPRSQLFIFKPHPRVFTPPTRVSSRPHPSCLHASTPRVFTPSIPRVFTPQPLVSSCPPPSCLHAPHHRVFMPPTLVSSRPLSVVSSCLPASCLHVPNPNPP